jgi:hypothetical protein
VCHVPECAREARWARAARASLRAAARAGRGVKSAVMAQASPRPLLAAPRPPLLARLMPFLLAGALLSLALCAAPGTSAAAVRSAGARALAHALHANGTTSAAVGAPRRAVRAPGAAAPSLHAEQAPPAPPPAPLVPFSVAQQLFVSPASTPGSVTIAWQTPAGGDCTPTIAWGASPDALTRSASGDTERYSSANGYTSLAIHHAVLGALASGF